VTNKLRLALPTESDTEFEFRYPTLAEFDLEDFDAGFTLCVQAQHGLEEGMTTGDTKKERKSFLSWIRHMRDLADMTISALKATGNGLDVESLLPGREDEDNFLLRMFSLAARYRKAVAPDTSTVKNLWGPSWRQAKQGQGSQGNAESS